LTLADVNDISLSL